MGIRIDSIYVKGLGPIASLEWQLKDINLVFGKNEQGKTYLVEYLLRSLFRNAQKSRTLTDSGQVVVSGLTNKTTQFFPKSKDKLEDLLFDNAGELVVDLSRLCVVKGGELSFQPFQEQAISKSILKDYLSDQRTLDNIRKLIPTTIQDSTIENGEIIAKKHAGQIKDYAEKVRALKKIDELLLEIDANFSQGVLGQISKTLGEIESEIEIQEAACRYHAYQLAENIKIIQGELDLIPEKSLDEVKTLNNKLENTHVLIDKNNEEIGVLEPECVNFHWLKSAIEECEKRPEVLVVKLDLLFALLSSGGIVLSIIAAFLGYPLITLGLGILSILFIYIAIRQYQTRVQDSAKRVELELIFNEFEEKFGQKARSIATLKGSFEKISPLFYRLQTLIDQRDDFVKNHSSIEMELIAKLRTLSREKLGGDDPSIVINKLRNRRSEWDRQYDKLTVELAATRVQPNEYRSEPVDIPYDSEKLRGMENKKLEFQQNLDDETRKLYTIKQRICDITGDLVSVKWEILIERLRTTREETANTGKKLKAKIISGILVSQVLSEIREREDVTIIKALSSPLISEPIRTLTQSYTGIELDGEELIVYNPVQRFPLANLSTGAQEQVLLALRLGIASHILKDQRLFLILDDAFQHSDWDRRESLVIEMADLANVGWQIIYFTMDNHIKKLFEERIKPKFNDRYQSFELKQR